MERDEEKLEFYFGKKKGRFLTPEGGTDSLPLFQSCFSPLPQ